MSTIFPEKQSGGMIATLGKDKLSVNARCQDSGSFKCDEPPELVSIDVIVDNKVSDISIGQDIEFSCALSAINYRKNKIQQIDNGRYKYVDNSSNKKCVFGP